MKKNNIKYLKNVKILFIIMLFTNLSLFTPIETLYFSSTGIPVEIISMLNLTVPIASALMEIPTGILGDYIGRKHVLSASTGLFALSSFILIFANSTTMFFLVFILEGIGWSFFSGNTDAIVVEEAKGKKVDIGVQFVFIYSGFTLAPIIAGVFNTTVFSTVESNTFKTLIVITFIFKFIAFLCTVFIKINANENFDTVRVSGLFTECLKKIKNSSQFLAIVVYESTGRLQFYIPVLAQYMLNKNNFDIKLFGILFTVTQIASFFAQVFANKILLKLNRTAVLKYSTFILGISLFLMLTQHNILIIIGMIFIAAAGPVRNHPLTLIKNEIVSDKIRATFISSLSFFVLIINFILLSFIGFLFGYSERIGLGVLIIIALIGGLITLKNVVPRC